MFLPSSTTIDFTKTDTYNESDDYGESDKEAPNLEKLAAALNLENMAAAPNLEKMAAAAGLLLLISVSTPWTRAIRFTLSEEDPLSCMYVCTEMQENTWARLCESSMHQGVSHAT